jgi:ATP-binding cassette subfamily G (WHITE) protein 2 (PDR)
MFDKLTVLYEGRQLYFGPADRACQYFEQLGFDKPRGSTRSDYLTSITDPTEWAIRPGFENRVPRSPDEFATAWKQSSLATHATKEMSVFQPNLSNKVPGVRDH